MPPLGCCCFLYTIYVGESDVKCIGGRFSGAKWQCTWIWRGIRTWYAVKSGMGFGRNGMNQWKLIVNVRVMWYYIQKIVRVFMHFCCRCLRGSVDWNLYLDYIIHYFLCRCLRGSVDWNQSLSWQINIWLVAAFVVAWIEIQEWIYELKLDGCRCLRGSVDWNYIVDGAYSQASGRCLRGSVDWNCFTDASRTSHSVAAFAVAWIEIRPGPCMPCT